MWVFPVQFDLTLGDGLLQRCDACLVFFGQHTNDGRRVHHVAIHGRLRGVVKKSKEFVKLTLGDWVILVIVTCGTSSGQPQPDRT